MSHYQSFLKNNLIILSGHLLIYAQGVILMPLIIKTIGVQVYGGYGILLSIFGLTIGISTFGVGFRRSRFLPSARDREERQALFYPQFNFNFISLMLLAIILLWAFQFLDKLFFKGEVSFAIWLVVPYFIFYLIYSQTTDYFRYTHRINYFNIGTLSFAIINVIVILLCYLFGRRLSINTLFIIQTFSAFLVSLPLMIKMVQEIGFRFTLPSRNDLVADLKLGFPLILVYLVDFLLNSSDRYVITAFISVTAVGYYNAAYALGSFIVLIPKISGVVLPPLLSRAVDSGDEVEARAMVNYTVKGFLLAAIPFVVGCLVLGRTLLALLANAEVADNAYAVTPIVAGGIVFYGLNLILANILFVMLKTKAIFQVNFLAALINMGLNIVIIYYLRSIMVAAVTTFISYFIVFNIINRIVARDWPIEYDCLMIVKSLTASVCMGIALYGLSSYFSTASHQLTFIVGEIIIGIMIYVSVILLLRTFSTQELLYLKGLLAKGEG